MIPENALADILKLPDPVFRQKLLRSLRESLQVPDSQFPSESISFSRDIRMRYKIPAWTLMMYGVFITRRDVAKLLEEIGYHPSRIDLSIMMSGKHYRYLFKREPLIVERTHVYTYGEAVSLLRHKYKNLKSIGTEIIRTFGYADDSHVYLSASKIIMPDVSHELFSYLRKHPEALYATSPRTFEEIMASIFRNQGYNVELTPPSKDGGYDLIAVQHNNLTGSQVYLVECKKYAPDHKVNVGIVRGLYGIVCSEDVTKGIIITTSSFTRGAKEFAGDHSSRLSLRDFESLKEWLSKLE